MPVPNSRGSGCARALTAQHVATPSEQSTRVCRENCLLINSVACEVRGGECARGYGPDDELSTGVCRENCELINGVACEEVRGGECARGYGPDDSSPTPAPARRVCRGPQSTAASSIAKSHEALGTTPVVLRRQQHLLTPSTASTRLTWPEPIPPTPYRPPRQ